MATDLYKVIIEAQAKGAKETEAALESLGKKTSLVSTATKHWEQLSPPLEQVVH